MTEYRQNTYEDGDMRDVIERIESLVDKKASIMAAAMKECADISKEIKATKKEAKDECGIPLKVLNPILKRRALERKIDDINESIDEDFIEVFLDAAGQFCMFAPVQTEGADEDDAQDDDRADDKPARTAADDAAEQAEGEAALEAVH